MRLYRRALTRLACTAALFASAAAATAQGAPAAAPAAPYVPASVVTQPGGGDLNPGLVTHAASIEQFQDMKVGLSVHWGPSSLGGKEISWARGTDIPRERYDDFYRSFNPVRFDADAWMRLAREGGMKYIILTSKHHDGFALWPSAVTPYNISATPFRRDIVRELSDAARRRGIAFGTYYSIIDWYHPDYQPYDHGGPGPLIARGPGTPDFERYMTFMRAQLRELVVDYGATIVQFDGEWDPTWTHQRGSDLYRYVRSLNDAVLVSNRVDVGRKHLDPATGTWNWRVYAGDFDERERMVDWIKDAESRVFGKSANPWQAWVTIDQAQWAWNETPRLQSSDQIILDLVKTIGDGGNYLINLGPKPDGSFDATQAGIIRTVGQWIGRHADGIYGTRGGPLTLEGKYTSTVKDRTITLYIIDAALRDVTVDLASLGPVRVTDLRGRRIRTTGSGAATTIPLPARADAGIRTIRIVRR